MPTAYFFSAGDSVPSWIAEVHSTAPVLHLTFLADCAVIEAPDRWTIVNLGDTEGAPLSTWTSAEYSLISDRPVYITRSFEVHNESKGGDAT